MKLAPRPALQLGVSALICAALLASMHLLTRGAITTNEALRTAKLLTQVMPQTEQPAVETSATIDGQTHTFWQIYNGEQLVGVVLKSIAKGGYTGDIELLVGVDKQLRISGVRVTKHRETPGLGDGIDTRRSDWIEVFRGLSLHNPNPEQWAVKKDGGIFDQFTGATITPRAVVRGIKDTLVFSQKHQTILFSQRPTDNTKTPTKSNTP